MRIVGMFCRNTRIPRTFASRGRKCWMTCSTSGRSDRGLRWKKTRPWLGRIATVLPPIAEYQSWTYGSVATISATCFWCCTSDSKEMSWGPSVTPKIWPVSSFGTNPLGTTVNR